MNSVSFDALAGGQEESPEEVTSDLREGMEVEVQVAGPQGVQPKTIELSLDNRGLIKLRFQEGGVLPSVLNGRFTGLADVHTALAVWQEREAKHYNLDSTVIPCIEGNGLEDELDQAQQLNPPQFPEPLDTALTGADPVDESDDEDELGAPLGDELTDEDDDAELTASDVAGGSNSFYQGEGQE